MNTCCFPQDTYANWNAKRIAGTLCKGKWIRVTDRADLGIDIFITENNEFSLEGHGGFLNADFQDVGDYSGVPAITGIAKGTNQRIWFEYVESTYTLGDIVFWNCLHYQLTDTSAIDGSNPSVNTAAYTLLPKPTTNVGYIEEWDIIEYVFVNDWIQYRSDKRGNRIAYSQLTDTTYFSSSGITAVSIFQWGNNNWFDNIVNEGLISQQNLIVAINSNILFIGAYISGNNLPADPTIPANTSIANNVLADGSFITNNTFIADNSSINNNTLANGGNIQYNNLWNDTSIANNILGQGATIYNNIIDPSSTINHNILEISASIENNDIDESTSISYNNLENFAGIQSNHLEYNSSLNYNVIGQYSNVTGNTLGVYSTLAFNVLEEYAGISDNNLAIYTTINYNKLEVYANINGNYFNYAGNIYNNVIGLEASISYNTFAGDYGTIYNNVLECEAGISFNTLDSDAGIEQNTLESSSDITSNQLASSSFINSNTLESDSLIEGNQLEAPGSQINFNKLFNAAISVNIFDSANQIFGNILESGSEISGNTLDGSANINYNTILQLAEINSNILTDGGIYNNMIKFGGAINSNQGSGMAINSNSLGQNAVIELNMGPNANISFNALAPGASIASNDLTAGNGNIDANSLDVYCGITFITIGDSAQIVGNVLEVESLFTASTLSGSISFDYNYLGPDFSLTGTYSTNIFNQVFMISYSAYDDDAAAAAAGLITGQLYQTTGFGSPPLNAAGIVMQKQ